MGQLEMRETPGELREQPPSAVHASRAAGFLSAFWSRPLARVAAFSLAIGLFLSVVGAFGSADAPFLLRTILFLAFSLLAGLLGFILVRWTGRLAWARGRLWRRYVLVAMLMTVIMTVAVWLGFGAAAGRLALAALPQILAISAVTSFLMTALAFAVFRPTPVTHAGPAGAAPPRFLARLPPALKGAELWAVQAEDHYLRIHTSRGSELILLRLADAVAELDGIEGAQTHRSWWVARAAVNDVTRGDGRAKLILPNGLEAPVSRTHARTLREAGWF